MAIAARSAAPSRIALRLTASKGPREREPLEGRTTGEQEPEGQVVERRRVYREVGDPDDEQRGRHQ